MKQILYGLAIMLLIDAILLAPGTIEQTHARARGCCMQKASNNTWYQNGMGFNQCRSANQSHDRNDDLYQPTGSFWWNENC